MKKKNWIGPLMGAALVALAGCSNETNLDGGAPAADVVNFAATMRSSEKVTTRGAFDAEKGEVEVLPYINAIRIRKVQASAPALTVAPYQVKTANKGVLEFQGDALNALKWDKNHLDETADFFAWTTPTGVTIEAEGNEGSVDFVAGNVYTATPADSKDKLDNVGVTPLEVFIGALSAGNEYPVSPSVTLPFRHLVSKLSMKLRNWNNETIHQTAAAGVTIEFLAIPAEWKVAQTPVGDDKAPFRVTEAKSAQNLMLAFTDLYYDKEGYFTLYLPPLTAALGTDFVTAGDFCITYGGRKFYGTLASIPQAQLTELQAGQHMAIQMDLSENYGVGVGAYIVKWKGPATEEVAYANPNRGVYSTKGLECLADYLESTDPARSLPDSLYVEEGGQKVVRLYADLAIPAALAARLSGTAFEGLVLDGQGHTMTLPNGANALFDRVGANAPAAAAVTQVRNLYLTAGELTGRGMLANTAGTATITNCHALGGRVAPAAGAAGGLIGTAQAGTELYFCSSVAEVKATDTEAAGGLVGAVSPGTGVVLEGCYAQSRVRGGAYAGGLVGWFEAGALTNSFFYSDGVKGCIEGSAPTSNRGTLAGGVAAGVMIAQCYWAECPGLQAVGGVASSLDRCTFFTPDGNVLATQVTIGSTVCATLMEALRAGTAASGMNWVWVYGKDYPTIEKK